MAGGDGPLGRGLRRKGGHRWFARRGGGGEEEAEEAEDALSPGKRSPSLTQTIRHGAPDVRVWPSILMDHTVVVPPGLGDPAEPLGRSLEAWGLAEPKELVDRAEADVAAAAALADGLRQPFVPPFDPGWDAELDPKGWRKGKGDLGRLTVGAASGAADRKAFLKAAEEMRGMGFSAAEAVGALVESRRASGGRDFSLAMAVEIACSTKPSA